MNITDCQDRQCYYRIMRSAKNIGSQTSELKGGNEDYQVENKFLKIFWIPNNIAAPYPACLKSSALQRDPLELFLPLLQAKVGWEMTLQELKAVTWTSEGGLSGFTMTMPTQGEAVATSRLANLWTVWEVLVT